MADRTTVVTEDGVTVGIGDAVYNYYDMVPAGHIVRIKDDGWFHTDRADFLDGSRCCSMAFAAGRGWT